MTPQLLGPKPSFEIERNTVLNLNSGFRHKRLCDGPTFTAGDACQFSCAYCYCPAAMQKDRKLQAILQQAGKAHCEVVIRRNNAAAILRKQLTTRSGHPRFADPADRRVCFASPLVDVAGSVQLAEETIELCRVILELTNWQIRLLSKSRLLPLVAAVLAPYRDRLIFGVSTGTLNEPLAAAIEHGTAWLSKRLEALHELQDAGFRTFGMACPSLPQSDYDAFAAAQVNAVRLAQCEHFYAEVLNERGASLDRTTGAMRAAGFAAEAAALHAACTDRQQWEAYARATFLAYTRVVPPSKLRFLQYVTPASFPWWKEHEALGAILLGRAAAPTLTL